MGAIAENRVSLRSASRSRPGTKRLNPIGNTVQAASLAVAVFLGGLALGALVASKFADRLRAPWRTYARLECGVAALVPLFCRNGSTGSNSCHELPNPQPASRTAPGLASRKDDFVNAPTLQKNLKTVLASNDRLAIVHGRRFKMTTQDQQPFRSAIRLTTSVCALALFLVASPSLTQAQEVTTDPVGFYKLACVSNADTLVSVPFTRTPEYRGLVASKSGNSMIISNNPGWTTNQWVHNPAVGVSNYYYVVVASNAMEGAYYYIGTNYSDTLIVTGVESLDGINPGDPIQIIPFWTLGTLFPSGQGVVPTTSRLTPKTQVKFYDPAATGINIAPGSGGTYLFFSPSNFWEKVGASAINANDTILGPDEPFVVRNRFSGGGMTTTTNLAIGAVPMGKSRIPVYMQPGMKQDNLVAVYRPAYQTLNESGLSNIFLTSTTLTTRDEIKFYSFTDINNAPGGGGSYVLLTNGWRKVGAYTVDAGTNLLFEPGTGYVIRKIATNAASTIWVNPPNYSH